MSCGGTVIIMAIGATGLEFKFTVDMAIAAFKRNMGVIKLQTSNGMAESACIPTGMAGGTGSLDLGNLPSSRMAGSAIKMGMEASD